MEKKIFNFFQAIDQYSKVVISRINKGQIVNAKAEITTLYEFIFSYFNKLYSDDKFLEKIVINSEELKFIHGETSITKNIHEFDLSFKRAELCLFSVKYFNDVTNKILKDAVKAESNILELLILELNNDLIRVIESEKKSSEREISALLYRNLEIINQSKSENVIYYTIPCYKWYISIVFYEDFNLNFLRSFDEYFFKAFQIIISKNNEIIWLQFIRDISNNFNIWRIYNKSLWRDYIDVFNPESYELEKEILLLENKLMTEISTRVEFSKVSEKILFVVEFIKKSYPHISDEQIENIKADFYQLYYKGLKKFNF